MKKLDAELKIVLEVVLTKQRQEIIRALWARGYRLTPRQAIEIVPSGGLAVTVRIVDVAGPVVLADTMLAREFFTLEAFERVIGRHPLTRTVIDRLHRLINGHRWTVAEFLARPSATVVELTARDWQPTHLSLLRQFLVAHALVLREI